MSHLAPTAAPQTGASDGAPVASLAADINAVTTHNPRLTPFWTTVTVVLTVLGVLVTMNQVFFWRLGGITLLQNTFLYLLLACFLPIVFIVTPALSRRARKSPGAAGGPPPGTSTLQIIEAEGMRTARQGVPLYDVLLMVLTVISCLYFASHGVDIQEYGWEWNAPAVATVLSLVFWALVVEILRRAAGWIVAVLALAFSLYPIIAGGIPIGILQGVDYDLLTIGQVHSMGTESILGMPLQTAGAILVGFLLFGTVLQHTGGADFFHNLSMAVFGRYRGGSAKVAVASSATMGMMSGSAVSNVLTTGPMTIPAMIRSGFTPRVAGAVEATASSGGSITPPIMGTAAFLMVSFVGVPYTTILVAATIPAFLYFLGVFLQIDAYAAVHDLKGTPRHLLPRLGLALKEGWPYLGALAVLTGLLFVLDSEAQVPFWIVGLLILIATVSPRVQMSRRQWLDMAVDCGRTLAQIIGIIAGVGLILGGLTATGVALSLSRDLVALVGDNAILLLLTGAAVCFVLGMGLTISAAYVFLAIVMVPAVITVGIDPLAAHLFVIYWASVSYITPPVGLAAFAAAGISKASPMATCVEAMRLGAVKYIVPFGFALNPALVAQASGGEILLAFLFSVVAVYAVAGALGGYLAFVERRLPVWARVTLAVSGFMMFLPQLWVTLLGLAFTAAVVAVVRLAVPGDLPPEPVEDSGEVPRLPTRAAS